MYMEISLPMSLCLWKMSSRSTWTDDTSISVFVYLKMQVGYDASDSKANQEQVGEDEGSGGVDDLLNLFVWAAGLTKLPERTE